MGIVGKTLRFVGGLAVGAGIGAVAAMLVAPQSGTASTAQIQARIDAVLAAGRRAARAREDELYAAWEAELSEGQPGDKARTPARLAQEAEDAAREREKARVAAQRKEDEAREKARKEQEEAQKHLDQARAELEKAEKAEKA